MQKHDKELRAATDPNRWVPSNGVTDDVKHKIQMRAYQLYEARGSQPGHELEDWVQAETEVAKQTKLNQAA